MLKQFFKKNEDVMAKIKEDCAKSPNNDATVVLENSTFDEMYRKLQTSTGGDFFWDEAVEDDSKKTVKMRFEVPGGGKVTVIRKSEHELNDAKA